MTVNATVRRCGRGYVRQITGDVTSGGHQLAYHLANRDDTSDPHHGYDPDCGWCWLGAPHTVDAHNARIGR